MTSKSPDMAMVDLSAGMGVSWQRQSTKVIKLTVSMTVSMLIKNCFWRLRRSLMTNSIEVIRMASHESGFNSLNALSITGFSGASEAVVDCCEDDEGGVAFPAFFFCPAWFC